MNSSSDLDLKKIVGVLYARRQTIVVAFLVLASLTAYLAMQLPDIYRSSILILISPQRLPASYVTSTVTTTVEQRIRAVSAEILSRTMLEKVVREFNLYGPKDGTSNIDERIDRLRKNIQIDVRNNDSFRLSFDDESAEKAMLVTARLGTIFIDENLQAREQQAAGTSSFIGTEAERLKAELESQEIAVNDFKAKYRTELPEQLDANLRTLEQLRTEQQNNMVRLTSLQERKATLEKQLIEAKSVLPEIGRVKDSTGTQGVPLWQQLESRKLQLGEMLTRYSDKHPDVIRLKSEIQALEAQAQQPQAGANEPAASTMVAANPMQQMIAKQIGDVGVEITAARATNDLLRGQIGAYQSRVDNTPIRAIELAKISRTYDITLKKYQDLLAKSFDSQLSQNMEKQQKGERFRLVDPAYLPETPVRPHRWAIVFLGLLAGLGAGMGLALLQENMDTSFKRGEELQDFINVPLLATLPEVVTRGSVLAQRRARQMIALASVAVLALGIVLIHLFGSAVPVY
ncbi:MAG TPA: XrtA system polysaccharide chain length determinant [Candidatus Binatia bacterium]